MNPERFGIVADFAPADFSVGKIEGGQKVEPRRHNARRANDIKKDHYRKQLINEAKEAGNFERLTPKQRKVLEGLYGGEEVRICRDVASMLDVSRQDVSVEALAGISNLEKLARGEPIRKKAEGKPKGPKRKRGGQRFELPTEILGDDPIATLSLWYSHMSLERVGDMIGCTGPTVARILREAGQQIRQKGKPVDKYIPPAEN